MFGKTEIEIAYVDDLGRVETAVHFMRYEDFVRDVITQGGIVVQYAD